MKASILASERNVVANTESWGLTTWRHLYEKVKEFLEEPFESDWERKTGLEWREWAKFRYMQ